MLRAFSLYFEVFRCLFPGKVFFSLPLLLLLLLLRLNGKKWISINTFLVENFNKTDMWRFWKCDRKRTHCKYMTSWNRDVGMNSREKYNFSKFMFAHFRFQYWQKYIEFFFLVYVWANVVLLVKKFRIVLELLLPQNCRFVNNCYTIQKHIRNECNPKSIRFELIIVLWYRRHLNKTIALCQSFP